MFSICIITKNEESDLKKCLDHLKQYPIEIIVVDTGSIDDSIHTAKRYTDAIYQFRWCDDFSAARNFAASKAHFPWIIMIDTDEQVTSFDYDLALRLIKQHQGQVGRLTRLNLMNRSGEIIHGKEYVNRIYQKSLFGYNGCIHEQIVPIDQVNDESRSNMLDLDDYQTFLFPMTVLHTGYMGSKEQLNQKSDRNIKLLLQQLEKLKYFGKQDPYLIYQLGKSYYMKHDYKNAIIYFEQAITFDLNPKFEYVLDLIIAYGYTLLALYRYTEALNIEGIYSEFSYSSDFIFLMGLIYMNNEEFSEAVAEFLKATQINSYMIEGVNSYKAFYNIGVIYECLGNDTKANIYYRKCGNYNKALERLKR